VVEQEADTVFYTSDAGQTKWTIRYATEEIQDLAVESADVIYAAVFESTDVIKSTNGGFLWDDAEDTGTDNYLQMIRSLAKDKLIVGSQGEDGEVAYSTDGNSSWEVLDDTIGGDVQATASGLATGDYIYAAGDDGSVYRWQIGTNTSFTDINADDDEGFDPVYGIALVQGALYVVTSDDTDSCLKRTLSPTTATDTTVWDSKEKEDVDFFADPQALKVSSGSAKLWATDADGDEYTFIYNFTDTLVDVGPTLSGPADAVTIKVNPVTGRAQDVSFIWNRLSNATKYDLRIALDKDFTQVVTTLTKESSDAIVALLEGPFTGEEGIEWQDGWTYYWKVRVSEVPTEETWHSPWSAARSFVIALATVTPPVTITPAPPAPTINLPAPTINLPPPQTITIPPAPTITIPPAPAPPAPIAPAYIWAIVIIGAVLVIAVIILIVRTRRPV
jgi:hypothetical protein